MNLIIVESPAKARTIKNFLSKEYTVVASKGHIMDLPKHSFGIEIDGKNFNPSYTISKEHSKTVKELKELAKKSKAIYIATDEDREGEAIGYHIANAIKKDPNSIPRIVFHEITKSAILNSLKNPKTIDIKKVNAQQARRLLDRIVGYKLSPLLSSKIQKGLSGGRVQSSALKIIIDREKEIKAFKAVEYWLIESIFNKDLEASLFSYQSKKLAKLDIKTKEKAEEIVKKAKQEKFFIHSIENKERSISPQAPFMTSTLQQSSSTVLGFSAKKTMMIAQTLYEGVKTAKGISGLITYMRTDSLNIAKEALNEAREFIKNEFTDEYLPAKANFYNQKSKVAQEAHEAIRPTDINLKPKNLENYLKADELKLYTLIYNRFLASQMKNAKFKQQSIILKSSSLEFKLNGRKLIFDGFYKIMYNENKDKLLPNFKEGEEIELSKINAKQKFTEPPPRYNEASLIKKMEGEGIGRPSTYSPTLSILQTRNYINIEKKQLIPTEISLKVMGTLEEYFNEIVDSKFTANMEDKLDMIISKDYDWQNLLYEFYEPFIKKIEEGKKNIKSQKKAIPTGENCPKCQSELVLRSGRFGDFVACSGFPKCKYTKVDKEIKEVKSEEKCDKCGSDMLVKKGRNGEFLACANYPKCKNTKSLNQKDNNTDINCPSCEGKLLLRNSKRGSFYGCNNYPKCKFISKYPPSEIKCKKCGSITVFKSLKTKEVYECINKECKEKISKQDIKT